MLAAASLGMPSYGVEAHPFIYRIARAKLHYRIDLTRYIKRCLAIEKAADKIPHDIGHYPDLIRNCFRDAVLVELDKLRRAWLKFADDSPESELAWLTIVAVLRSVSHVGTAPWQYVLPRKAKRAPLAPRLAFSRMAETIANDINAFVNPSVSKSILLRSDARTCVGVPTDSIDLVITSPPYANNYDYADATRLEMSFMGEVAGWGDLQATVRQFLVRSCSQHVPPGSVDLDAIVSSDVLRPIRDELRDVCSQLTTLRSERGGKKTYNLMVACYFLDMANVWQAMRRVCKPSARACFVIGDSAPYGIYLPVSDWMGRLAKSAGFAKYKFEKTRDRNIKWKNRKHRVPLCEGRLWVWG
ncbi:MAG: hypothetical protein FD126_551 [Elusimicrobia bacterium]|nr:MAG: hypothetical protein FD126_551 [Elusimicrobiota bacterium]